MNILLAFQHLRICSSRKLPEIADDKHDVKRGEKKKMGSSFEVGQGCNMNRSVQIRQHGESGI